MKVKKFVAPTLKEASTLMKKELGSEAFILSTRVINKRTDLGIQKHFEITSGIEEDIDIISAETNAGNTIIGSSFSDELMKLQQKVIGKERVNKNYDENESIIIAPKTKKRETISSEKLKEYVDRLIHHEVSKPIIKTIVNQIKKSKEFINPSNIEDYIITSLSSLIPTTSFEIKKRGKQKIVAIVGPTGVGKTTCIAKLAAISKILNNLKIGIISIDTYRLGAIDQLRIFSEVSNIDMLVAYEAKEMPGLIKKFSDKDLIFIDTAGRGQKNRKELEKTKEFLDVVQTDKTYLAISATNSTKNLEDVVKKFELLDYSALILTKIDEGVVFGNILNVVVNSGKPLIYLTNGQVIPDDIIAADSDFIAKMVVTGETSS
ncbi:MAG: flagellar biosynthesis protein FlhF [Melioribacteraceae bacterium]|nr:flagellar biosynthesis protein FlhF [Melioribacteraceae bacterium]